MRSRTFEKEVKKRFARSYPKDIDEDKWNTIEGEIEAAPCQQQIDEQNAAAAQEKMKHSLLGGLTPPIASLPQ
jgi:hypothetical protein